MGAFCIAQVHSCARLPACRANTHLCLLAALEQAPAAAVGEGQVCGQVTQDPNGDPRSFPAYTDQVLHALGDLLAVMLQPQCAGCQGLQVGRKWSLAGPKLRVRNLCSWVGGWAGVSLSWLSCVRLPSQGRGVWIPADALNGEVTFSCENFSISSEDRS